MCARKRDNRLRALGYQRVGAEGEIDNRSRALGFQERESEREYVIAKVSGSMVQGAGFRVQGSGFRVQGSGFRVQGLVMIRDGEGERGVHARRGDREGLVAGRRERRGLIQGLGFGVWGLGFRVQGFGNMV